MIKKIKIIMLQASIPKSQTPPPQAT